MSIAEPVYAGIILAAGRSSRMGRDKAMIKLPSQDSRLLATLLLAYDKAGLAPIIVALGPGIEHEMPGVIRVEGDADQPMIDSLSRAIAKLPKEADAAVVQPVDAPYTTAALIAALIAGPTPARARVPYYEGAPGHPVLIARALFSAIAERPQGGLRAILAAGPVDVLAADDERILADLDTPADIEEWET